MRIRLAPSRRDAAVAVLTAALPPSSDPCALAYSTRTGALLRIDGVTVGAFDREHRQVLLPPAPHERRIEIEAELQTLPTHGLPSGPGVIWWFLNRRSRAQPVRSLLVERAPSSPDRDDSKSGRDGLALIGHSHLDVAWLWDYEQTARKAQRTFAIACDLLERDPDFVFTQSQPQLYAFVEREDQGLFERVCGFVRGGRFDADLAALWVESDCNVPSGESLLRQMLFAHEYAVERFGIAPRIAWLPDSFGFANTIPQMLAHAGIPYFATTKLQWNDTTRFPHPQFRWRGPDGSEVISALIDSYDGPAYPWRVARARERKEPLVLGYGDGGGGVTGAMLRKARSLGTWIRPREWFDRLAQEAAALPVHQGELYLEYHRGVYTTHHDAKAHNALLERALAQAEELLAWCFAVHAPRETVLRLQTHLNAAWEIVLRNQFHDVLPGTSITAVYADAAREYVRAEELVAEVMRAAQAMLPRAPLHAGSASTAAPHETEEGYRFENRRLRAQVTRSGVLTELALDGARNLCTHANVLALYADRPRQWEAWNIDRGYAKRMRTARPQGSRIEGNALVVDMLFGRSPASMRLRLQDDEPFLRVDLDVEWRERRTLLRVENWLCARTDTVTYGAPHGTLQRSAAGDSPQRRAQYEVPGQRFAAVRDADAAFALLSLDTYGWSARCLPGGGMQIGHSLLRGTCWPDPDADRGDQTLSYAFAPLQRGDVCDLEQTWERFAYEPRVRLFTCEDETVRVVACKIAQTGERVIVRVRECGGRAQSVRLRSAARMTNARSLDGLERPIDLSVRIEGDELRFELGAFALRTFGVDFHHD